MFEKRCSFKGERLIMKIFVYCVFHGCISDIVSGAALINPNASDWAMLTKLHCLNFGVKNEV